MKKKSIYFLLIVLFIAFTAFVVIRFKVRESRQQQVEYRLKERQGPAAQLPEWAATKQNGELLYRNISVNPGDTKSKLALISLYIQEARITGDYAYYDAAAMKYTDELLAKNPKHFEALVLKAILQLSQHHFSDALETASVARTVNPYNAFIYGIMVDGNVELGNYAKAVEYSDMMMSIRPDIRSYSRVSYLREIHGDAMGAIEAMKMAVDAGGYGDEGTAWARIQLARLYEITGDPLSAKMHYSIVLQDRPGFGYALAGMGNIAMSEENLPAAIAWYKKADTAIHDYGIKEQLANLYLLTGHRDSAFAVVDEVIKELTRSQEEGAAGGNHHADKELAYLYILKKQPAKAIEHALKEYNTRPDNIDVNEAVAWAYYQNEDYRSASAYLEKAMRTNSKNPTLLCRGGLICYKAANTKKAQLLLQEALKANPNIDPVLKKESAEVLKRISN